MKKKLFMIVSAIICTSFVITGCGSNAKKSGTETSVISTEGKGLDTEENTKINAELPDGEYMAEFKTDSSMFHVSEACDGKGKLSVQNGEMTIHISLTSKKIINLFPGTAEEAAKDGAKLLTPTVDTVTYSDGMTEEVNGFDVPVPALDQEFDLALLGTKGVWYDHKVSVSNPQPCDESEKMKSGDDKAEAAGASEKQVTPKVNTGDEKDLSASSDIPEDGIYCLDINFEGGSGKARIESPATVTVKDGKATARVTWSSPNYDYMIVDGQKYEPVNTEGNSVFEIPVAAFDQPLTVIGDTIAMSTPHEIEYTLTFQSDSMRPVAK